MPKSEFTCLASQVTAPKIQLFIAVKLRHFVVKYRQSSERHNRASYAAEQLYSLRVLEQADAEYSIKSTFTWSFCAKNNYKWRKMTK